VKLTTARYYTPNGRSIQARGIDPDVLLLAQDAGDEAATRPRFSEAALPGHLRGNADDDSGAGEVLDGTWPIDAALDELKRMLASAAADH